MEFVEDIEEREGLSRAMIALEQDVAAFLVVRERKRNDEWK